MTAMFGDLITRTVPQGAIDNWGADTSDQDPAADGKAKPPPARDCDCGCRRPCCQP